MIESSAQLISAFLMESGFVEKRGVGKFFSLAADAWSLEKLFLILIKKVSSLLI